MTDAPERYQRIVVTGGNKTFGQHLAKPRQYEGDVDFACLYCDGLCSTKDSTFPREQIPNGIRVVGVKCPACERSFTVELTRDEQEHQQLHSQTIIPQPPDA